MSPPVSLPKRPLSKGCLSAPFMSDSAHRGTDHCLRRISWSSLSQADDSCASVSSVSRRVSLTAAPLLGFLAQEACKSRLPYSEWGGPRLL